MQHVDNYQILKAVAKTHGKWAMLVSFQSRDEKEVLQAAPCLKNLGNPDTSFFIQEGGGILVFDSEAEATESFHVIVGDDGPTKTNPYNGPVRVFACLCNSAGDLMTVNT